MDPSIFAAAKGESEKRGDGKSTVYVLENKQLRLVTVTSGITDNRRTEVMSPEIKSGDQVVVEDTQQSAGEEQSSSRFRMRLF